MLKRKEISVRHCSTSKQYFKKITWAQTTSIVVWALWFVCGVIRCGGHGVVVLVVVEVTGGERSWGKIPRDVRQLELPMCYPTCTSIFTRLSSYHYTTTIQLPHHSPVMFRSSRQWFLFVLADEMVGCN